MVRLVPPLRGRVQFKQCRSGSSDKAGWKPFLSPAAKAGRFAQNKRGVMRTLTVGAALFLAVPLCGQVTNDPFEEPIESTEGVVRVNYVEFATLPDVDGEPARAMTLTTEPGSERMFVSDMRGLLYSISYDGGTVTQYLDLNDARWGHPVQAQGRERGVQSFAFHPQFAQAGTPGYGKFYTWLDTSNTTPTPDYRPLGGNRSHDTVLLEWTAQDAAAATYDGSAPRELLRLEQPYGNHNGGHIAFRPGAEAGDPDFGLLYMGIADGGSGGDPHEMAQNLTSAFGKIFLIDPLGSNAPNGKYGYPMTNLGAADNDPSTLGEIYAYGVRNPQRFNWDPTNQNLFLADIGQNTVEEISLVPAGANLGWNDWEGSFRYIGRDGVEVASREPGLTYPVAEYDQMDPLIQNQAAATGVEVYRSGEIPQLSNMVLWGDMPSGEIFYFSADQIPDGGQEGIRRILFNDDGQTKTLLQVIQAKNMQQGRDPASRADMRLGSGPDNRVLVLNKYDGVIRMLVP